MKVLTILGTRPEIIRLSLIVAKLDRFCTHVVVNTGQNYAESLNDIFFKDLGVRRADYDLGIKSDSFGDQIGKILAETERVMLKEKPDKLLILGDTNSGLSAISAKRLGIVVYHMEAGNRCYDDRVPEEINRRIIDHCSDVLLPYTNRSKENLVREGIDRKNIYVTGNPIFEVLKHYEANIEQSAIFKKLSLRKGEYFLVTMHRAENVDDEQRLKNYVRSLELLSDKYLKPIVCSLHPRTKSKMEEFSVSLNHHAIKYLTPLGFFDFVALEKNALCVLSDSGTVQEECCIFNIPNVTIRDVTERPETIECGSNMITGNSSENVLQSVEFTLNSKMKWIPPGEYLDQYVSDKVLKILFSYNS